jgi:predicted ATPase
MPIKISSITAKQGQPTNLGLLTILIGANNCGKSQTLRDIRSYVTTGTSEKLTIASDICAELPPRTEGLGGLTTKPHPSPGHLTYWGVGHDLQSREQISPHQDWLQTIWHNVDDKNNRSQLLQHFGKYWIAHLNAESRFRLSESTQSFDTRNESPSNALQTFFVGGKEMQDELRVAFKAAFRRDIALDWGAMSRFYLKVGTDFGQIPDSLEALDKLLKDCPTLESQGDGYRSFAGIVLAKLAFKNRLLLLDEPEAFLHPSQARALGKWLAEHSKKTATQVILATHSADLLWGIVSENDAATVIRLNRSGDTTSYHAVSNRVTRDLVESPLLSSQPVLDALFQKGVIICEGDPDRAIYNAVATRHHKETGGDEIACVHSNGKDAAKTPAQLFRKTGTPVAFIADIDILNSASLLDAVHQGLSGRSIAPEFEALRKKIATYVEGEPEQDLLDKIHAAIRSLASSPPTEFRNAKQAFRTLLKGMSLWGKVKSQGVEFFARDPTIKSALETLLAELAKVGLFVVPVGELEGWLKGNGPKGHVWNRNMLEIISKGNCPENLKEFVAEPVRFIRAN